MSAQANVIPIKRPESEQEEVKRRLHWQTKALCSDYEQQAYLLDSIEALSKQRKIEKAKFLYAFLNPKFYRLCLESIEGAKDAVLNYWCFNDGDLFYRQTLAFSIGKIDDYNALFDDLESEEKLLKIATALRASVIWSEKQLQGERIK